MTHFSNETAAPQESDVKPDDPFDPPLTDEQVAEKLEKLSAMSRMKYAQQRTDLAAELGVPVGFLDAEYKERHQPKASGSSEPASVELFPEDQPWDDPVEGADLLTLIVERLKRHVIFTDDQAVTVALWIAFAWTHDCYTHSPMLLATSAEANSGKTTLLGLVRFLSPRALATAEISPAALYRSIEKWKLTIVLDEADVIFREKEELRAVVNSGWTRGTEVIRCVPETFEPQKFSTFCPKAIGMKGKRLPDTTLSRCIVIELTRKLAGEDAAHFNHVEDDDLIALRRMFARWAADHSDELTGAKPSLPEGFDNRLGDNWSPLFAIADVIGGAWPERVRRAAVKLSPVDLGSVGTMLLADIQSVFEQTSRDRLSSEEIVTALHAIEDRPWAEWRASKPITKVQLAGLLRPFKVSPDTMRFDGRLAKGYSLSALGDAFRRYLDHSTTPIPPSDPEHRNKARGISASGTFGNVTSAVTPPDRGVTSDTVTAHVTDEKCEQPNNDGPCYGVTDEIPPAPQVGKVVCEHCGQAGGDIVQVFASDAPVDVVDGVLVHRGCIDAWNRKRRSSPPPAPPAPAPVEMKRPSPWGNDVKGWEKWFEAHPEELGKLLQ